jgi:hypothetical protein
MPDGIVGGENWKVKASGPASNISTVTVVLAVPTGPVGGVYGVVVVVGAGAGAVLGGAATTEKTPFMPCAACPETVER